MKKKLLITLLLLVCSFVCASFIACGDKNDSTHKHTFSADYAYNNTYHYHKPTCGHELLSPEECDGYEEHTIDNGECTVCDYVQPLALANFVTDYATLAIDFVTEQIRPSVIEDKQVKSEFYYIVGNDYGELTQVNIVWTYASNQTERKVELAQVSMSTPIPFRKIANDNFALNASSLDIARTDIYTFNAKTNYNKQDIAVALYKRAQIESEVKLYSEIDSNDASYRSFVLLDKSDNQISLKRIDVLKGGGSDGDLLQNINRPFTKISVLSVHSINGTNIFGSEYVLEDISGRTVSFNSNGGNKIESCDFVVGEIMSELPTPTRTGFRFSGWFDSYGQKYDTTSVMPDRDLALSARWEKIVSTYTDSYVSLKPATSGVKNSSHNNYNVDQRVYVEITSNDLKGGVDADNNFTLRTLDGMEYSVNEGYSWIWYYDDNFSEVNGAQRFSLHYGNNLQFVTVNNSSGVTVRTYLVNIYVLHDYYVNLYKTVYDTTPYTRVKVIENNTFPESTATASLGDFEFDKRVYYNENIHNYVEFDYYTRITKDLNLYQTYKPVTMPIELNDGAIDGNVTELQIKPYMPYSVLPVPTKDGYDFLGWKLGEKQFTDIHGYAGMNYISQSDASQTLSAVFEEKKYYLGSDTEKIIITQTVPVVTYADETMSEILEVLYVPYDTDCALPTVTPQIDGKVFYEWSTFNSETHMLVPYDFNTKITEPTALIASTVPAEYTGTALPLNKEVMCTRNGTYVVYLPTASRYVLNVTTTGNVKFTVNAYGAATAKNYTATSSLSINLDYMKYVTGGATQRDTGYITFNVTSASGTFTVNVRGATGETDGRPIAVSADDLVALNTQRTYDIERLGYIFDGFYDGETLIDGSKDHVFTVTAEKQEYNVKWHLNPLLENFEYNLSSTQFIITGIKNHSVTEIIVPDDVTNISGGAFSGCGRLVSITLPFSFNDRLGYIFGKSSYTGGVETDQGGEFCTYYIPSSLKSVIVSGVRGISYYAFKNCSSLTSITISNSVTTIGNYAFYGCSGLTSIEIPNSVTSIGSEAFYGCTSLQYNEYDNAYYLGDETNPYVALIKAKGNTITSCTIHENTKIIYYDAFYRCSSLSNITIPTGVTSIGSEAFSHCSGLTSITIPNSVTSIGSEAFSYCSGLTSVTIPNSVTSIGKSAFHGCTSLQYNKYDNAYYLGNETNPYVALIKAKGYTITSCTIHENTKSICDWAFAWCESLTSITIPNGVTSIGDYTFYNCSKLASITFQGTMARWNDINRGSFWNDGTGNYTVHCTDGNISKANS